MLSQVSQAEHGPTSPAWLVTTCPKLAKEVNTLVRIPTSSLFEFSPIRLLVQFDASSNSSNRMPTCFHVLVQSVSVAINISMNQSRFLWI